MQYNMNSPASMTNTEGLLKWYNEECFAKCLASIVWSIGVYQLAIIGFVFLSNLSLWYPLAWISDSASFFFSFQLIFSSILVQMFCCFSSLLTFKFISAQRKTFLKQSDVVPHMIESKQLLKLIANVFLCILTTFVLKKFSYYAVSNDGNFFLLLLSVFIGVYFTVYSEAHQTHVVAYPVINQKRFYRAKKMVQSTNSETIYFSLKILQVYYVSFVFFVCIPRSIVTFLSNPSLQSASSLMSFVYALCDIQLFWLSLCLTFITMFMLNVSYKMLHIYLTEHIQFPYTGENSLTKAISAENFMLKTQAIYDLLQLSKVQNPRRNQIYMLTQPGSQAHTWNTVCLEGLRMMDGMKSVLQQEIDQKQHSTNVNANNTSAQVNTLGSQNLLTSDSTLRMRNIQSLTQKPAQLSNNNKVEEKLDVSYQNSFFNNFPVLYLYIEALSNLVAASISEDRYGVVQIKLPDIISSMFDLLETCEFFSKVSLSPSHHFVTMGNQNSQQYLQHVSSLKIALKTGLYTITTTFGHHLSAIRLSKEHQKRLHGFIEMVD